MPADESQPVVYVRVLVNVDGLRVGEEGEVELSPRIEKMIKSGYLQIIGHVWEPPAPSPFAGVPEAVTVSAEYAGPVANPTRSRAPAKESDGPESAHPA